MTNFRAIFEDDWCGIEKFLTEVLAPIFGEYQKGYDILTKDAEVKKRASLANITEIKHAATFDLIGSEIKVFDISVSDKKRLAQSRVGIQQVVRQYINQFEGALIVFHHENVKNQEWRLSYVEKLTGAKDTTSAKRYTYILGKEYHARTITERFNSLLEKKSKGLLLKDLTDAFSVEPVSDEFFDAYRNHYANLVEYISGKRYVKKGGKFVETKISRANAMFKEVFNQDDKEVRDFVKKMMGRLVFLQFLQKKGWLGVDINGDWGSGDKNFLYNLFQNASEDVKKDFLNEVLNPLFFKTLNTDRGVESVAPKAVCDVYGKKVRIPYLNGGLFEEEEIDKKHVKFRKEDFDKLFNFFTEYNFTIDESDPVDVEIGIDPEMLGKIFENLLEDNKDKGAFYTPKEIVQYMCRESLIAYLSSCHTDSKLLRNFSDAEDRIRQFVLKHETNLFSDDEKKALLKALRDIKVCDPAVGSGAFPMGMMNELLGCIKALIAYLDVRNETLDVRRALDISGETLDVSGMLKSNDYRLMSNIKKHIIKNNIYGVDIEKGAVDIARLRFWLSIIVDEKEPIPLPNLDYKIMQGNSLLESYKGVDLSRLTETDANELGFGTDEIADLVKAIDGYYTPNDQVAKNKIRKNIHDKVIALLKAKGFAKEKDFYEQLSKIDLHANTEFFLWHTWFGEVFGLDVGRELDIRSETIDGSGEILKSNDYRLMSKGGFDIVIGNPPYVESRSPNFSEALKNQLQAQIELRYSKEEQKSFSRGADLLIFFFELSFRLMNSSGINTFITENSWLSTDYGKEFQTYLLNNVNVKAIIDSDYKYFDGPDVNTVISIFTKKNSKTESVQFFHCHENLETHPCNTNKIDKNHSSIECNTFPSNSDILRKYKWGFIFSTDTQLISLLEQMDKKQNSMLAQKISIGQGLNITKDKILNNKGKDNIPYFVSDNGSMYCWNEPNNSFVSKNIASSTRKTPLMILPRGLGTHFCCMNEIGGYSSSYVEIYENEKLTENEKLQIWAFCNSSLLWLLREYTGRCNLGGGMLKAEATDLKTIPICFDFDNITELKSIYTLAKSQKVPSKIEDAVKSEVHKRIDKLVFEYFGLPVENNFVIDMLIERFNWRGQKSKRK